jgi:hypothetical protein
MRSRKRTPAVYATAWRERRRARIIFGEVAHLTTLQESPQCDG